jgi:hypothetical protein
VSLNLIMAPSPAADLPPERRIFEPNGIYEYWEAKLHQTAHRVPTPSFHSLIWHNRRPENLAIFQHHAG